ncbi:hypothetical protein [Desulfotomaculum sp. 1211_IL3151]|uniref:hypothetical protein n=1 Tax=Desulfotomaculum sp. 1211_IL3151 TaxID=3084055 RepID=UPI002FD92171
MKRKISAVIVTLALGALLVPAAFAAVDNNQAAPTQNQQFFNQMYEQQKNWLDNAVKNNQLTEEQAKAWSQHFDQMKEFHSQNGMGPGMMGRMMGNDQGRCPGFNNANGNGFGPGMMGNFR